MNGPPTAAPISQSRPWRWTYHANTISLPLFCRRWTLNGLAPRLIESHYEGNYGSALTQELEALDPATASIEASTPLTKHGNSGGPGNAHIARCSQMKIDGGCFLRQHHIRSSHRSSEKVMICHCTDCQNITGSAFRVNVPVAKEHITFRGGQPKTMVKTAESGNKRAQAFCPECGSPLYGAAPVADPPSFLLRSWCDPAARATAGQKVQTWSRSALDWAMDVRAIPRFPKGQGT